MKIIFNVMFDRRGRRFDNALWLRRAFDAPTAESAMSRHLQQETYGVRGLTDVGRDPIPGTTTAGRVLPGRWRQADRLSGATPPDWPRRYTDAMSGDGGDAAVIA